ncbi:MAG: hypothetical protein J0M37_13470 [Ignavibacteria bacterium]|nr:hypothetical protein [Ignavibacteria bacterium]
MPVPTHDRTCFTRAFETKCPDCNEDVWFFSCTCGSKVYFDALGWPWPIHICRYKILRDAISTLKIVDRMTDEEIYHKIETFGRDNNLEVTDQISEMLEFELGKRKYPFKKITIDDLSLETDISGKVMNINKQVSFKKRLSIDIHNPIAFAMSKNLLNRIYYEITIRENPNKKNESREFVVYIDESNFKKSPIAISAIIIANIKKIATPLADLWEITTYNCY